MSPDFLIKLLILNLTIRLIVYVMKQCFFLVSTKICGIEAPVKVFLQEQEAVKYGRRFATDLTLVKLYKQEITRNGMIEFVRNLDPYRPETKIV